MPIHINLLTSANQQPFIVVDSGFVVDQGDHGAPDQPQNPDQPQSPLG
jgi:hypothetical protein